MSSQTGFSMEHRDELDNVAPSQGDNAERVPSEGGDQEGINAMRWQREEEGRMSLREAARRKKDRMPTPILHRVTAMPNMMAGAQGDSESEDGGAEGGTARQFRRSSETREGHPANMQATGI